MSGAGAPARKIVPFLWFDGQAEEAARLYTSLFPNSRIGTVSRYGTEGFEAHGQPAGRAMVVEMDLDGVAISGLNGGPVFRPTPAVSFFAQLETEALVDAVWAGLAEGGTVLMPLAAWPWSRKYGWLNDRYGVSWQISLGPKADVGQTITPSLLFTGAQQGRAEAAIRLYTSVFAGSGVQGILRNDGSEGEPAGTVKHAQFRLAGETFMAMDSAQPHAFGFTEGTSFMVLCADQAELDHFWSALTAEGGEESMCGWLKDRFGLSWQIIPTAMMRLMSDPATSGRAMQAMLSMRKLDIAALEAAAAG